MGKFALPHVAVFTMHVCMCLSIKNMNDLKNQKNGIFTQHGSVQTILSCKETYSLCVPLADVRAKELEQQLVYIEEIIDGIIVRRGEIC